MNILIMNYRYFVSGGPERYLFGITEQLETKGHTVIPFSFAYSQSKETPYAEYFATPPGGTEGVFFKDLKNSPVQKLKVLGKSIYNFEAKRKVKQLIRDQDIDLVYALQIVNVLYPSVIDACREMGVPVVYRLSDFQFVCPSYKFFRDGRICEDCINGQYYHGFVHKCLKNSYAVSGARVFAMYLDRLRRTRRNVEAFVTPSTILREKMIEGGFPADKLHHIPTFVDVSAREPVYDPGNYILYAGAIDPFKGVWELLDAFAGMKNKQSLRLVMAGYSLGDEQDRLEEEIERRSIANVEFPGFKSDEELAQLYRGARCVAMPTLWYENMPNVVLEAMAYGKPVVGSNHGGVTDMIDDGETGLLFEPGNVNALRDKLEILTQDDDFCRTLGVAARKKVESRFSPARHCATLCALFEQTLSERGA